MLWFIGWVLAAACGLCLVATFIALAVIGAVLRFLSKKARPKKATDPEPGTAESGPVLEGEYVEIDS